MPFYCRCQDLAADEAHRHPNSGMGVMASEIPSVLVANAHDDVKQEATRLAKQNNQQDAIYIARGNFLGMNGNYSAGILEGVTHYNPEVEKWFNYE